MEHYILFYSNNCIHCKELAQLLYKSPLYEKFQKICIDDIKNIRKDRNALGEELQTHRFFRVFWLAILLMLTLFCGKVNKTC